MTIDNRSILSGSWVREWQSESGIRSVPDDTGPSEVSAILEGLGYDGIQWDQMPITRKDALRVSAVFACLRILSDTQASLPLALFERQENGGKKRLRARDHHLPRVLRRPNPIQKDRMMFGRTQGMNYFSEGNSYAEIEFDPRTGDVVGLWPLPSRQVEPELVAGEKVFTWHRPKGRPVTLPDSRVLHVMGLSFDGIKGLSPLALARNAVSLSLDAERFGHAWYRNGGRLGTVFTQKSSLSVEQKKADRASVRSWARGGLSTADRVLAFEEGSKLENVSIKPSDAEFLRLMDATVADIGRIFGVPLHKLAKLERATHTNAETQSREFLSEGMLGHLSAREEAFGAALLLEEEQDGLFFEHILAKLLQADSKTEAEVLNTEIDGGFLTVNEVRSIKNLPRIDSPLADATRVPLNMALALSDGSLVVPARKDPK